MKHWDYYEYRITEHYMSAMINADFSGMEDAEISEYEAFKSQAREAAKAAGLTVGHWAPVDGSGEDWGVCAVTGLRAMRCTVRLMVYREDAS